MKELISKILKVQEVLDVPKNRWNDFGGYYYRNCEDVLEAVKPHLVEHGLLQTLTDDIQESNGANYVKATVTVTDGKDEVSVSAFAREIESKKKMDSSQLTGTASSYARKYALNGMWNIDDVKDPDTGAHETADKSEQPKGGSVRKEKDTRDWLNKTHKDSKDLTKEWKNATKAIRGGRYTADQIIASYRMKSELKQELKDIEKKA